MSELEPDSWAHLEFEGDPPQAMYRMTANGIVKLTPEEHFAMTPQWESTIIALSDSIEDTDLSLAFLGDFARFGTVSIQPDVWREIDAHLDQRNRLTANLLHDVVTDWTARAAVNVGKGLDHAVERGYLSEAMADERRAALKRTYWPPEDEGSDEPF